VYDDFRANLNSTRLGAFSLLYLLHLNLAHCSFRRFVSCSVSYICPLSLVDHCHSPSFFRLNKVSFETKVKFIRKSFIQHVCPPFHRRHSHGRRLNCRRSKRPNSSARWLCLHRRSVQSSTLWNQPARCGNAHPDESPQGDRGLSDDSSAIQYAIRWTISKALADLKFG